MSNFDDSKLIEAKNILLFDIETSYNKVALFQTGKVNFVAPSQILEERQVICISWKYYGHPEIHTLDWGLKKQNDKQLLHHFCKELNKATFVVGHNSNYFDIPWINGRLLYHGLKPTASLNKLDTLQLTKKTFNLNSYKLDYISKFTGSAGKDLIELQDWINIVEHKDKEALDKMIAYNRRDVLELEKVFKKILPYVKLPSALFALESSKVKDQHCTQCGSTKFRSEGWRTTACYRYRRWICCNCGYSDKFRERIYY